MHKWRYAAQNRLIGAVYAENEHQFLNRLGTEGWELVSVVEDQHTFKENRWVYFFKQEIIDAQD